ncbi:hypothetical protein [uncultured Bacteroides sp.]|uniref:hypothetical protein n=1 Tax=uncultured Bacteroides sp. TaxID=162156 RepID=UPI002610D65F|nr:hypothetical protein [uncultured Bacteroides sp.]
MYYTKKHYPFQGFFLLFAGLSLLGCTDEDDNYASVHPGNAIQFSVERIATRTHYEDKYEENGSFFYPIDWDAGDRIFISSADAYPGTSISGQQYAIYSVAPADDASYHGSITAIDPSSDSEGEIYGLHWGMGENFNKSYTFYGAYPAQRVKGYPNEVENMTSGTLTMQYYTNQVCKITSVENGQYESEPDMMNAYMLAKKTLPSPTADHILLDFKPIMTTLDIHITAGNYEVATGIIQPVTITGVSIITPGELTDKELQCSTQALDGDETTLLSNFISSSPSKECVFVGIDNALKSSNEKSIGCVDLFEDESLHLMAFLPPFENVSDGTQIKIHAVGGLSFEFTLNKGQNYFEAQKRIDVQLPDVSPVTTKANDWISQLNDDKLLRTLSIPGYECKEGDKSRLNDLLNMGVRAFDVDILRGGIAHIQNLPQDIRDIFKNFLLQHPKEFIILLYDNTGDLGIDNPKFELTKDNWNIATVSDVQGGIISLKKAGSGEGHYEQEGVKGGGILGTKNELPFGYNKRNDALLIPNSEWTVQYRNMEKDATEIIKLNKTNYEAIIKTAIQEGWLGIVMTPYAGEIYADDTYTYSDLLIQSIIDCNFKLH